MTWLPSWFRRMRRKEPLFYKGEVCWKLVEKHGEDEVWCKVKIDSLTWCNIKGVKIFQGYVLYPAEIGERSFVAGMTYPEDQLIKLGERNEETAMSKM